jgi:hypothetical protein
MPCSGCNKDYPIQNKKYNLCSDCVFAKNHEGKTRAEVYGAKIAQKPRKIYEFKRSAPIQQTKREKRVKTKLSALKTGIELDAVQSEEYYCKGCGISYLGLDKSHILSVGQFKGLELDAENIDLLCRDCHNAWESGDIQRQGELLCFERYLLYTQKHSDEYFSKLIHKMHKYLYWNPQGSLADSFRNILKKLE